jgi:hypothetical protein
MCVALHLKHLASFSLNSNELRQPTYNNNISALHEHKLAGLKNCVFSTFGRHVSTKTVITIKYL